MRAGQVQLYATSLITALAYSSLAYVISSSRPAEYPPVLTTRIVSLFPHFIAIINATALATLYLGYKAIKRGDVDLHRRLMLASFGLISAFLALYVTKLSVLGVQEYEGPQFVRLFIYLPILLVHLGLSVVSVPLVVYNVLTGLTLDAKVVGETGHPKSGRLAYRLWSVSLFLGLLVYIFLRYL